jgi:hypothetical protein
MPNHVTNTLEIYAWHNDRDDLIEEIRAYLCPEDSETYYIDFDAIMPQPDEVHASLHWDSKSGTEQPMNWYKWRCDNWGTKWNAYSEELIECDTCTLIIQFDTAWAPPEPIIARIRGELEKRYPMKDGYEISVRGAWIEEGYQSAGVF